MGGFVSILIGRQINRLIPHFVISFPPNFAKSFNQNLINYECGSTAQVGTIFLNLMNKKNPEYFF